MAQSSPSFDEELLSGFLDGTLPHRDMQRVRILLEENPEYRRLLKEMRLLRESALTTRFTPPADDVWPELPKTRGSLFSRTLGWILLSSWLTVVTAYALWTFVSRSGDPFEIFLVLGMPGAFVLLFISVLMDRLKEFGDDRYHRDVHR